MVDPGDPPGWLWQFRFSDWAHVEFPPQPADFGWAGGVFLAPGASFWQYCRARDHWREQCKAWLQANDRILAAVWPDTRAEFMKQAEAEPWRVLRHDRDRPRRRVEEGS